MERSRKTYGLVWEDHPEPIEELLKTHEVILEEVKDRRIELGGEKSPNHLLIEGDNYEALTYLKRDFLGKIGVIYIDPPYNTKNKGFKYNDHYENHSKWLSFMSKRLKLAKDLMSEDGVIFISIDDHEMAQLKLLCDEIFGESNFVANIVWKKGGGKSDSKYISNKKEYLLCYKRTESLVFNKQQSPISNYKLIDEKGRRYALHGFDRQGLTYTKSLDYPIECPDGSFIYAGKSRECYIERQKGKHLNRDWCWTLSESEFEKRKLNNDIVFKKQKDGWRVYYKSYYEGKKTPFDDIYDEVGNQKGAIEIKNLFNDRVFDFPKPLNFVKHIINLSANKNPIVLDFFAGSGTTGHAVLELNKEDGGNRQFILCTNNENNICEEVTYERLKRVIQGYQTPKGKEVEGIPANFTYYQTKVIPKES